MPDHLIQPIFIDGAYYCLNMTTGRTAAVLTGDAYQDGDGYFLYNAPALTPPDPIPEDDSADSSRVYSGTLKMGILCNRKIVIYIEGILEDKDDGQDKIIVKLNGVTKHLYQSEAARFETKPPGTFYEVTDDNWSNPYNISVYEETITIPNSDLTHTPCGNILSIEASTQDIHANNGVLYYVEILTPLP